jgi:uroporphyrinogen decarboxylase
MALGTPQLVDEKCKDVVETLGSGAGLIRGPGCALPPQTPPENVHAMIEAAQRYGKYQ